MNSSDKDYVFTWPAAIVAAEETRKLNHIAELLRDERVPLDIHDRRMLAELLAPTTKGAKLEAVLQPPRGRPNQGLRNYDFYNAVEKYKHEQSAKEVPRDVMLEIGKGFGLLSYEACQSALRRGRKIAEAVAAANEE